MEAPKLPNRFHIGTQKAGSTFLYNLLASHPDVSLSKNSEVHYYSKYFDKGEEWYVGLFEKPGIKIDTSPKYFMNGEVAALRIREAVGPQAKFLLILRNPIDLLNSHYQMHKISGHFSTHPEMYPVVPTGVVDCVTRYPDYLKQASYFTQLQNSWLQHFAPDQFKVVIFEEFIKNVDSTMDEVLTFFDLPVRKLSAPAASKNRMLKHRSLFILRGKIMSRPWLKRVLKKSSVANYLYERWLTQPSKDTISPEERAALCHLLQSEVTELEAFLGREIERWHDFHKE